MFGHTNPATKQGDAMQCFIYQHVQRAIAQLFSSELHKLRALWPMALTGTVAGPPMKHDVG